jgi:hypothetical protein
MQKPWRIWVLSDADLRSRLASAARRKAEADFSIERMMDMYIDFRQGCITELAYPPS